MDSLREREGAKQVSYCCVPILHTVPVHRLSVGTVPIVSHWAYVGHVLALLQSDLIELSTEEILCQLCLNYIKQHCAVLTGAHLENLIPKITGTASPLISGHRPSQSELFIRSSDSGS